MSLIHEFLLLFLKWVSFFFHMLQEKVISDWSGKARARNIRIELKLTFWPSCHLLTLAQKYLAIALKSSYSKNIYLKREQSFHGHIH